MVKHFANLTHHERLRYDYLQKNIHFLGERDKAELHYLEAKIAGSLLNETVVKKESPLPVFQPRTTSSKAVQRFNAQSNYLKKHEDRTISENPRFLKEKEETLELPRYVSRSERRKAQVKTMKTQNQESSQSFKKSKTSKSSLSFWKKTLKIAGVLLLVTALGMLVMFFKGYYDVQTDAKTAEAAEIEVFNGQDTSDGVNILILGTDSRIGQTSADARTDSIMVVNVGNSSGKVKMVSFMRDTLINIPEVSYEDGYNTYYDQKLNVAFSIGEQNDKQGAEAIRVALKQHFDIDIKYYAMIDFVTFATAIDTLFPDGVLIDAQFSTINGEVVDEVQVPDDLNIKAGVVPEQTIQVGEQRMDGRTLLNYARFRKDDSGDFGRTERQQQVMQAIFQQIKDPTKLFTGSAALGKIMGMTSTSIPYSFILSNGLSAVNDASDGIERMTVPEQGDWVDAYDMYGGLGLLIDFDAYQERLAQMGLR